jgi:hypothetical protein
MKDKKYIIAIAALVIVLLVTNVYQYRQNIRVKESHGEIYRHNISTINMWTRTAREYMEGNDLTMKEAHRQSWRYNDFVVWRIPVHPFTYYFTSIRDHYYSLYEILESGAQEEDMEETKAKLLQLLTTVEQALGKIEQDCGDDLLKYYNLKKDNNKTIDAVMEILGIVREDRR